MAKTKPPAPRECRFQVLNWYVETGYCDAGGIGFWTEPVESVMVASRAEADRVRDEWLAEGKLVKTPWATYRPAFAYGLFRIRSEWKTTATGLLAE